MPMLHTSPPQDVNELLTKPELFQLAPVYEIADVALRALPGLRKLRRAVRLRLPTLRSLVHGFPLQRSSPRSIG
jgi:hypothetical protein